MLSSSHNSGFGSYPKTVVSPAIQELSYSRYSSDSKILVEVNYSLTSSQLRHPNIPKSAYCAFFNFYIPNRPQETPVQDHHNDINAPREQRSTSTDIAPNDVLLFIPCTIVMHHSNRYSIPTNPLDDIQYVSGTCRCYSETN